MSFARSITGNDSFDLTLTLNGTALENTTIGQTTPAVGTFTTLTGNSCVLKGFTASRIVETDGNGQISVGSKSLATLQGEVDANTAKTGITTQQASDITTNNAKIGITVSQAEAIVINWEKVGITTSQADAIVANTAKTGISTAQANAIVANTAKVGITTSQADAIVANTAKTGITAQQAAEITANTGKTGITSTQTNAIVANTAKVGITTQQASEIASNNAKIGITSSQASAIATNTAKTGITTSQADAIVANTAKVGITSQQASDITTNNAKTGITTSQASAIATNTGKTSFPGFGTTSSTALAGDTTIISSSQATAITNNTTHRGLFPSVSGNGNKYVKVNSSGNAYEFTSTTQSSNFGTDTITSGAINASGTVTAPGFTASGNSSFSYVGMGNLSCQDINVNNHGITNAGPISGATTIDGTGDLTMGTITMTGFIVDADGDTTAKTLAAQLLTVRQFQSDGSILTTFDVASNGDTLIEGDLRLNGNDIKDSLGTTRITLGPNPADQINLNARYLYLTPTTNEDCRLRLNSQNGSHYWQFRADVDNDSNDDFYLESENHIFKFKNNGSIIANGFGNQRTEFSSSQTNYHYNLYAESASWTYMYNTNSNSYGPSFASQNLYSNSGGKYLSSCDDGSDRRLKKDIEDIDYNKFYQMYDCLTPRQFKWKENTPEHLRLQSGTNYGFISQEVEKTEFGWLVRTDKLGDPQNKDLGLSKVMCCCCDKEVVTGVRREGVDYCSCEKDENVAETKNVWCREGCCGEDDGHGDIDSHCCQKDDDGCNGEGFKSIRNSKLPPLNYIAIRDLRRLVAELTNRVSELEDKLSQASV